MRKLNLNKLGKRVFYAWELGKESERKFNILPQPQQKEIVVQITDYISAMKNEKLSIDKAHGGVQKICDLLGTSHPFDVCTHNKFLKYLGYNHVFNLVYNWTFNKITISLGKEFSVKLTEQQEKLSAYRNELSQIYFNFLNDDQKQNFWNQKKLIKKHLSNKKYIDLKATIVAFEETYGLKESLYSIIESTDDEDIRKGIFNAVVTTYAQVERFNY
ncbi:MAG: hypothetical protein LBI53_01485 [Candidatus Peribacteria bacterium]|jgi:hypothetical protein|nr:hypothetical protein [Candidatus Peribacteria bacterium]